MAVAAGAKLGPYEILALIGAGGMGEVYKARDTRLDRTVAIKVSREKFSERFELEARAVAALNHPHICQLYDVGPNYLVMEYIDGAPLKGPLPLEQAIKYAGQICDALDAAHKKGITHRDLKPANIMVTKTGVKLLDFGLARIAASPYETVTMAVMGTPAYMAPEQWEGKPGDARSDIYAFGCVLYEMLTGKRAAQERAAVEPPATEHVIKRCLERDPDDRWQSARDLRHAIELPTGGSKQVPSPWRERAGWIAAALLALSGAGYLLIQGPRTAAPPGSQAAVHLDLDLGPDVSLGFTTGPAVILSPDGTRLVFVSEGADGIRRLFIRRLDQANATPLVKTEGAYIPFFSPDGEWVGFFAQGKLKKARIDGGEPISLCEAPAGRGASWGEDGTIIAALDAPAALSQVPVDGGNPIPLSALSPGEITHRWPQILPGGKAVLFNASVDYGNYDEAEIAVLSLKNHHRKTLLPHGGMYPRYLSTGHLVYATKGALFAVRFDPDRLEVRGAATPLVDLASDSSVGSAQLDVSPSGTLAYRRGGAGLRTIQWLDAAGKSVALGFEPAIYNLLRLSSDGGRLAYIGSQGAGTDIWIYDLQRGSKTRLTKGGDNSFPVWSPDNRYVVFHAPAGVFWTRADGASEPRPLLPASARFQFPTSFSPDGKLLAYSELTSDGKGEIRMVPVESGSGQLTAGKPRVFLKTTTAQTLPTFSPDGRWLAYASAEGGSYEVYVRAFPDNGTQVQISAAGGIVPVWSRNSHELFYRTEDNRIMVANYTVKAGTLVADKPRLWTEKQLAFVGYGVNLDLAPDGKRFIALLSAGGSEPAERQSHVRLVVNFFDEVRRRVAGQGK
jgi:serine/threonine-protein kinase